MNPYYAQSVTPQPMAYSPATRQLTRSDLNGSWFNWVDSEQEAYSYPAIANSRTLFMDKNNPVIYAKSVDAYGNLMSFDIYDMIKRESKVRQDEYVKLSDLEALIDTMITKRLPKEKAKKTSIQEVKIDE